MRRRLPETDGLLPAELTDSRLWPLCPCAGGGVQPCTCWWAKRQTEFLEAGNEWPGGEGRELTDLLEMQRRHPCREPFDGTLI